MNLISCCEFPSLLFSSSFTTINRYVISARALRLRFAILLSLKGASLLTFEQHFQIYILPSSLFFSVLRSRCLTIHEGSSELSDPPSSSEEERDENAPPRRRRGPSSRKLRKAREKKQKAAAAAAKQVKFSSFVFSATGGRSDGICYAVPGQRRYERCVEGGSCKKIPKPALPVALYFLDYCRAHPGPTKDLEKDEQKIKEKRRIAAKVILDGIADNTFPDKHDIRLREAGVNLG
ncbi:uncharacterized protein FFUJ_13727 [Fusarium fujikuroi IMI 58289]|uniref:Uncharacterized protein n=1 Tax=Gibberella fujikuroi (strain CBS 195.34 / IMI 58289 / NRRL A-6831) TaxID=1279085 RepID=S0EEA8_GIBF5|nr:uncharacterized protein FFUJ_13727 [Fusarium fujikuroi IMI 58289]QGI67897.1 hypothetical protein CEK27_011868 [Fusarium fujikuroi]QGI98783.1 hypothetical protein CEK26_011852 [Fusarium fujikuroi]CCT73124.1 uncharacterized protein FFUJ_13727 [Fusarium fujikuroi IMI 58289]